MPIKASRQPHPSPFIVPQKGSALLDRPCNPIVMQNYLPWFRTPVLDKLFSSVTLRINDDDLGICRIMGNNGSAALHMNHTMSEEHRGENGGSHATRRSRMSFGRKVSSVGSTKMRIGWPEA